MGLNSARKAYDAACGAVNSGQITEAEEHVFWAIKKAAYRTVMDFPAKCLGDVLAKSEAARIDWGVGPDNQFDCRVPEAEADITLEDLWRIARGAS